MHLSPRRDTKFAMHVPTHKGLKILVAVGVIGMGMYVANHLIRATPEQPAAKPLEVLVEVPRKSLKWDADHFTYEGKPFTGIATEFHPDGKPKQRWSMKDGKWHGLVQEWYPSGQQSVATNFLEGKRHGENSYFNPDGTVQKKQLWDNDTLLKDEHPPHP